MHMSTSITTTSFSTSIYTLRERLEALADRLDVADAALVREAAAAIPTLGPPGVNAACAAQMDFGLSWTGDVSR